MGGFYQRFRSKRQLLLVLMDEMLEGLSQLDVRPKAMNDVRAGIRALLSRAFSHDLRYAGAYRAWQEAALSDRNLARKRNSRLDNGPQYNPVFRSTTDRNEHERQLRLSNLTRLHGDLPEK